MKLPTITYSLVFLCAGLCCPDDGYDDSNSYSFNVDALIEVQESRHVFAVNDTIWIKTRVPLIMEDNGQAFNISEISGNTDRLYSYFGLYQLNNFENPLVISLSENEVVTRLGDVSTTNGITATAYLQQDFFISEFGIVLKESGNYVLSSNYEIGPVRIYVDASNPSNITIMTGFRDSEDPYRYNIRVE